MSLLALLSGYGFPAEPFLKTFSCKTMFRRCVAGCLAFSRGFIHLLTNGLQFNVGAAILPVVCVGNYAIAGADSVVTKDMPDYAVVVGNPAKVVKHWIQAGFSKNGVNN